MSCTHAVIEALQAVCEDCPHSVDIDGRVGCRFVGKEHESGGVKRFVPSACALARRMRDPALGCPDPDGDRWAGIDRPTIPLPVYRPRPARSAMEVRARICHGHKTDGPDAVPTCEWCDRGKCAASGTRQRIRLSDPAFCVKGKWPHDGRTGLGVEAAQ